MRLALCICKLSISLLVLYWYMRCWTVNKMIVSPCLWVRIFPFSKLSRAITIQEYVVVYLKLCFDVLLTDTRYEREYQECYCMYKQYSWKGGKIGF